MKGGFNNPPNRTELVPCGDIDAPSMKGGFNNPPNMWHTERATQCVLTLFNEGGVQ